MTTPSWDAAYATSVPPPWDLGLPQPAFVRLAARGMLTGQALDAGCGTGEQTLLAASSGAEALGVDVSPLAVEQARAKAAARGISARFEVSDALSLEGLGPGLRHHHRQRAVPRLRRREPCQVRRQPGLGAAPGRGLYLMCFSDRQPGAFGPRRVSRDELRAAFGDGWTIALS